MKQSITRYVCDGSVPSAESGMAQHLKRLSTEYSLKLQPRCRFYCPVIIMKIPALWGHAFEEFEQITFG